MLGRELMNIQAMDTALEPMTTQDETTTLRQSLKGTIPVGPVAAALTAIGTATDASMPVTVDSRQSAAVCAAVAGSKAFVGFLRSTRIRCPHGSRQHPPAAAKLGLAPSQAKFGKQRADRWPVHLALHLHEPKACHNID